MKASEIGEIIYLIVVCVVSSLMVEMWFFKGKK